jgi:hypothetical protein
VSNLKSSNQKPVLSRFSFGLPSTFFEISLSLNAMRELSLAYYNSISKGNVEMLKNFKTFLLEDFKSMDVKFFSAAGENDIPAMHKELHKMYPIVFNLNFSQMLDLIEKYRHCKPDEFATLHAEMKMCLTRIYDLLEFDS